MAGGSPEFSPERRITTLGEFSSEVQRLLADSQQVEAQFDELCRSHPDLADQYLSALAAEYEEANGN